MYENAGGGASLLLLGRAEPRGGRTHPEQLRQPPEKNGLTFDVLSDVGSEVASRYGLAFDLPEDLAAVYEHPPTSSRP